VGNAQRHEFAVQSHRTVVPLPVGRVTGKELIAWPVERMHVQDRRVLSGPFDIAVDFTERVVEGFIFRSVALPHRQVEIDRGCNGRHHGKDLGVSVGEAQRPLAPHAGADDRDAWRLDGKASFNFARGRRGDRSALCRWLVAVDRRVHMRGRRL